MSATLRDPTCLRPNCAFGPLPKITDAGALGFYSYCSASCKAWSEAALTVAQAEYSPAVERRAHRLHVLATLLDLRDNPGEMDELAGGDHA
ncbi:hypothetical protein OG784_27385 [Streptomyces sp. NBC_01617]|uniref:hypothetical protein n=1 Tax=Streptomyces sp. NBC_01617 TaxID=2975899 RepID=UPI00386FE6D0|nr:hypothetical protein OG784_27385 [Streptomyces sp. NBC_01617]